MTHPRRIPADLLKLLWGNGVSTLGNAVYLVAVLILLKELTESALVLGLFQFVALFPGFLLSPIAGVTIDATSRRRIIILADVARGAVMVVAGVLLTLPELRTPALVLVVSFVVGAGNAFFVPAAQALIPDIVDRDDLQRANGLRAGGNQLFNLGGNAVGGFLYSFLGAPLLFMFNGITFLLSAVQERRIEAPRDRARGAAGRATGRAAGREPSATLWGRAQEGIRAVVRDPHARVLFISQAGLFLVSPALLLALPFIVMDELQWPAGMVGVFFAVSIAGGVTVFLAASRLSVERLLRTPAVPLAYLLLALVFLGLAVVVHPVTLAGAAFVFGGAAGAVYLYTVTWIQARNSATLHGRLFALLEAGNSLVAPVSYVATGAVLEFLGPERRSILFLILGCAALIWAVRLVPFRISLPRSILDEDRHIYRHLPAED